MLVMMLAVAGAGWYSNTCLGDELGKATGPTARQLELAGNLKAGGNGMRTGQRGVLLNALQHDSAGMEATRTDYLSRRRNVQALLDQLRPMLTASRGLELASNLETAAAQHAACFQKIYELSMAGSVEEAAAIYKEKGAPAGVAMEKAASALMAYATEGMASSAVAGGQTMVRARTFSVLSVVLGACLLAFVYLSQRSSTIGLRRIVGELEQGSQQIVGASRQLTAASQSLAQGSSEQAAALQQTSASAGEIHSAAAKNTEKSRDAAALAANVRHKFDRINRTLEEMVGAMKDIGESSGKISRIIRVVDEIAFQTNILALNAAVEAARAGDAGMGFAVVADEVRSLAQRSAQAARDTTVLIDESIERSKQGQTRMDEMAAAIVHISQEEMRVKCLVDEISVSSAEQTRGFQEISHAAIQMQQATQNIAAAAQETAAAVHELDSQGDVLHHTAERLGMMVGRNRA